MPLRVLSGVEQQALHRRRQPLPADLTWLCQGPLVRRAELVERTDDLIAESGDKLSNADVARLGFTGERGTLRIGQLLTARVREQPVDDAREMPEMEPDRRDAGGAVRQTIVRQRRECDVDLLARLQQRVRDGLQQRGHTVDGTAQPDFGSFRHLVSFVMSGDPGT